MEGAFMNFILRVWFLGCFGWRRRVRARGLQFGGGKRRLAGWLRAWSRAVEEHRGVWRQRIRVGRWTISSKVVSTKAASFRRWALTAGRFRRLGRGLP